jgi:hypothetical protein
MLLGVCYTITENEKKKFIKITKTQYKSCSHISEGYQWSYCKDCGTKVEIYEHDRKTVIREENDPEFEIDDTFICFKKSYFNYTREKIFGIDLFSINIEEIKEFLKKRGIVFEDEKFGLFRMQEWE